MPTRHLTRRTFVGGTALLAVGAAGCAGRDGTASSDTGSTDGTDGGTAGSSAPEAVTTYLVDTDNYDGVVDATGSSEVTVVVGSEANGGNFGYEPAAVRVSPASTVVWEWTGLGGSHNIVAEDGAFESELVAEEGHTFSWTFEKPGAVQYYCTPHRTMGMKGVVLVE